MVSVNDIFNILSTFKHTEDTLNIPSSYLMETGALVYDNAVFQPGDRLLTYSNNTGDSSSGAIMRGNGDPAYVRGVMESKNFQSLQSLLNYIISGNDSVN